MRLRQNTSRSPIPPPNYKVSIPGELRHDKTTLLTRNLIIWILCGALIFLLIIAVFWPSEKLPYTQPTEFKYTFLSTIEQKGKSVEGRVFVLTDGVTNFHVPREHTEFDMNLPPNTLILKKIPKHELSMGGIIFQEKYKYVIVRYNATSQEPQKSVIPKFELQD